MHRRPEEAPYFCSLCGFKAFTWDALTKHVETFAMHRRKIRELGVQVPSSEYLKEGQSQGIEEGVDYNICSQEESQEIWGARPKRRCKTVTSTQESIQQLEGLIPEDLLQQVMTHCGIISSPTFSEMASPGVTLDEEPSYAMPSSTTAPVCSSTAPARIAFFLRAMQYYCSTHLWIICFPLPVRIIYLLDKKSQYLLIISDRC